MIGKLKGILENIFDDYIILDVQGIGYAVFISNRLRSSLPSCGESLSLFIETHVREDAIRLFGFATKTEQNCFCLLQNVPGVGAKVALAILGILSPDELAQAITLSDIATISRAPGVGKKVSERIVGELKGKILSLSEDRQNKFYPISGSHPEPTNQPISDALSALINLGYDHTQAANALTSVTNAFADETLSSELLIRHSLKFLASHLAQGKNA